MHNREESRVSFTVIKTTNLGPHGGGLGEDQSHVYNIWESLVIWPAMSQNFMTPKSIVS